MRLLSCQAIRASRFDRAFGYPAGRKPAETLELIDRRAREMEGRLAVNLDMFTSEVPWTDRVYCRWPAKLRQHPFGGEAPRGDRYPAFALAWPPAQGEFSRAVAAAKPARLALAAYNIESGVPMAPVRLTGLPHEMEFPLPPPAEVSNEVKRDQP